MTKKPSPLYTGLAFFEDRFCFFGVVWPAIDGGDLVYKDANIIEYSNGAWVLVTKQTPPLVDLLPRWDRVLAGWYRANEQTTVALSSDGLIVTASGNDAAIISPEIRVDARQASRVLVTARATRGSTMQLFWTTLRQPAFDELPSSVQRLRADGEWHTYEFIVSKKTEWQGVITRLRLDPMTSPGAIDIAAVLVR
ncbi:MAG: hypothetical protein KKA73_21235 [Chloroflexi bacterium]|nr:hypothetical protein [Chloroflexota bacterium]MBU1750217.1 hypothetical protein [Chloroflexota bacterium]